MSETIFALASGAGRAGVAIIRLSGERVQAALDALGCAVPAPRKAVRARFKDPASAEVVDDGLLLWFPAPYSYTGEDVAELHVHGGRAIINTIFAALAALGLRPAEPGEFTRRAFANGKLDLTQAEALADLVEAETRAQARQALRQMGGALKALYDEWRYRLVRALAHLEAVIDFPDEDLPRDVADKIWAEVGDIARAIGMHLDDQGRGERIRDGVAIAIIGPPNAGKSSLLNALARRDVAIVASTPGTTRDVVEVHLDLGGYAATVADTAGLREATDAIETEGIRRTHARAAAADLKIALFDANDRAPRTIDIDANTIVALNKVDLIHAPHTTAPEPNAIGGVAHCISVQSGFGMTQFLSALTAAVKARLDTTAGAPLTRARHRRALEECRNALLHAPAVALPELAAEDVRIAVRALGRITGRVDVEEVLDVVFRDFCIGK